jgi:hypothetical protein
MFPVWLFHLDGTVTTLLASPGAGFTVRMCPEQIAHIEGRYPHSPIQEIATDTPTNIIWSRKDNE